MRLSLVFCASFLCSPLAAQQAAPVTSPLDLVLQCSSMQTRKQSHAVKSDAFGFGNPTAPDTDQSTGHVDRSGIVELHGNAGRLHLGSMTLAGDQAAEFREWVVLEGIVSTPQVIVAHLNLSASGQILRIDRTTGTAEITGYGRYPLRGICHVDRKPTQF